MKPTEKEINKNITEKILENNRLFKSLRNRLEIPQEKVDRYREELASDNWKNYSKKLILK
jgi:hypothetical protein